ncbi:MAG TPA: peptidyl-prolyl cis-trans isomerase [Pseudolabrys sp.]|nr:peptidyl-prolyl cis-trans isomerase [Pseudolabrys sp.]
MLRGFHKATSTWLGKTVMATIMGVLVISFAVWGIGDIFSGYGRNSVAEVGGTEISVEQFRQYYNDQLQRISRQLGKPVSQGQARALGLDRQILGQMVAEVTLDEKARQMHLGVSDQTIADKIRSDPTFNGPNGQFSRQRFEEIIREAGYTEARFVAEQRNVLLRRQIAQSISGDIVAPKTAVAALAQFRDEKRDIEFVALGPDQVGEIPAPSPEELKKYYDAHKAMFRAPEYRKLTLLSLSPADLANPAAITDAEAKTYYEQHKEQYGKPEKREIRQIIFPSEADAKAAREKIAKGASFNDIVKERGLKPTDTDIGMVAQSQVIDPAVAKAAFALKPGEVSQPIKGNFGTVLVTVGKIEPGEQKSYEQVAPQIKQQLAEVKARGKIGDLRDKIEDEKAAGSTLAEAAQKLGLKVRTIDAVDRAGRGPNGQPIAGLPKQPDVISAAFNSDVGVDNEALRLPDNGYLYFDVNGITPSHERAFDQVKGEVQTHWRNDEIAKRLKAKADDMVTKLKEGGTLAELASANKVQVQTANGIQRGQQSGFTSPKLVEAAFSMPKGVPGKTEGQKETEFYVYRVTKVEDPKLDMSTPEARAIADQVKNAYTNDIIGEYITQVENELGVSVNQTALNQVIGGEPGG